MTLIDEASSGVESWILRWDMASGRTESFDDEEGVTLAWIVGLVKVKATGVSSRVGISILRITLVV